MSEEKEGWPSVSLFLFEPRSRKFKKPCVCRKKEITLWRESGWAERRRRRRRKPTTSTDLTRLTFEPPSPFPPPEVTRHRAVTVWRMTVVPTAMSWRWNLSSKVTDRTERRRTQRKKKKRRAGEYYRGNDKSICRCSVPVTACASVVFIGGGFVIKFSLKLCWSPGHCPVDQPHKDPFKSRFKFKSKLLWGCSRDSLLLPPPPHDFFILPPQH